MLWGEVNALRRADLSFQGARLIVRSSLSRLSPPIELDSPALSVPRTRPSPKSAGSASLPAAPATLARTTTIWEQQQTRGRQARVPGPAVDGLAELDAREFADATTAPASRSPFEDPLTSPSTESASGHSRAVSSAFASNFFLIRETLTVEERVAFSSTADSQSSRPKPRQLTILLRLRPTTTNNTISTTICVAIRPSRPLRSRRNRRRHHQAASLRTMPVAASVVAVAASATRSRRPHRTPTRSETSARPRCPS